MTYDRKLEIQETDRSLPAGGELVIPVIDRLSGDKVDLPQLRIFVDDTAASVSSFDVAFRIWNDARDGNQTGDDHTLVSGISKQTAFTTDLPAGKIDLVIKNNDGANAGTIDVSIYGVQA